VFISIKLLWVIQGVVWGVGARQKVSRRICVPDRALESL
jgi:hypothetical protein